MNDPDIQRDWPEDAADENGSYYCVCIDCGNMFTGHKRRLVCRVCAVGCCLTPPTTPPEDSSDE